MPVEKKHDFTKKEIQAGALVLCAGAVLLGFMALVLGWKPERETVEYYAHFTNTIGLKENAEVRFGGMLVGDVIDISPDPTQRDKIRVGVAVTPGLPINAESIATIEQISLTTDKHLEISTGKADAILVAQGGTLKSVTKSGGFVELPDLDGLVSGSEDLVGDLRDLLGVELAKEEEVTGGEEMPSLARIAGDVRGLIGVEEVEKEAEAKGAEPPSMARIAQDARTLLGVQEAAAREAAGGAPMVALTDITSEVNGVFARYEPQLDEILGRVPGMQDSVQKLLDELNAALSDNRGNLDATIEDVAGIVEQLNAELDNMMGQVGNTLKSAEGLSIDMQAFVAANRPVIENLLGDLARTVQNLSVFMQDLKSQPQSVLWGKPAQGRK